MGVFNNFMHPLTLSFLFVVIVIRTSWSVDVKTSAGENPADEKQFDERISNLIAENALNFSHNMALELAALDPGAYKNQIFSPLSIMTVLSFLMLGAKGNSYQELIHLLGLDSDSELMQNPGKFHEEFGKMLNDLEKSNMNNDGVRKRPNANWRFKTSRRESLRRGIHGQPNEPPTIKIANGFFLQSGNTLNPDYKQVIESIYKSILTPLDFENHNREARDYINKWINKTTLGKIPELISNDIDKSTNIIIASALYFKAFWETPFFFGLTRDQDFYPDGRHNPSIKAKMMINEGIFAYYDAKEYDCRIIGLPYKGNETTMYVIQPNHSTRQRLRELQHALNARRINEMIDKMERDYIQVTFPKTHFKRTLRMSEILGKMNVHDVFLEHLSDLSLIGKGPPTSYVGSPVPESVSVSSPLPLQPLLSVQSPDSYPVPTVNSASEPVPDPIAVSSPLPLPAPIAVSSPLPAPTPLLSFIAGDPLRVISPVPTVLEKNMVILTDIDRKDSVQQIQFEDSNKQIMAMSEDNRTKRDVADLHKDAVQNALLNLENDRSKVDSHRTQHFVDEIIHEVDFSVDEQGTEGAAATASFIIKSGPFVFFFGNAPFLILIRHDPTKLPLFYGIINKPEL